MIAERVKHWVHVLNGPAFRKDGNAFGKLRYGLFSPTKRALGNQRAITGVIGLYMRPTLKRAAGVGAHSLGFAPALSAHGWTIIS